jgi:hypothetical protein
MVNLHKSELLVTADQEGIANMAHDLALILNYKASTFPIVYLGLPLSDKKLPKELYHTLIHQEEQRLSGWKLENL